MKGKKEKKNKTSTELKYIFLSLKEVNFQLTNTFKAAKTAQTKYPGLNWFICLLCDVYSTHFKAPVNRKQGIHLNANKLK